MAKVKNIRKDEIFLDSCNPDLMERLALNTGNMDAIGVFEWILKFGTPVKVNEFKNDEDTLVFKSKVNNDNLSLYNNFINYYTNIYDYKIIDITTEKIKEDVVCIIKFKECDRR